MSTLNKTQILATILQSADRMMSVRTGLNDDIFEHLPTLFQYAQKCDSVIEAGVRNCISSYPLIKGLISSPNTSEKKMVSLDLYKSEGMKAFELLAKELLNFEFVQGSDLDYKLTEPWDLLFIDTFHVYGHLKRELHKFTPFIKKYIIMHDTTVDEYVGECIRNGWSLEEYHKQTGYPIEELRVGLWPAITEFLEVNPDWKIRERFRNNNGLTILERVDNVTSSVAKQGSEKVILRHIASKVAPADETVAEEKITEEVKDKLTILPSTSSSISQIINNMITNNCKDIEIITFGNHQVFTEITQTLQRQLIDKGVLCKNTLGSELSILNKDTFYILFNAHQDSRSFSPSLKYAVYNYEQAGSQYVTYPHYIQKMLCGNAVFDYSEYNRQIIEKMINKPVYVYPFKYHPSLTRLQPRTDNSETVDILFYGVLNANRQQYYDILKDSGYKVKFITNYSCFGDVLYQEMSEAKIVLNLHYYTSPSILEQSRIVPLIANHKLVLSETSSDTVADQRFRDMVVFVDKENILAECKKYLDNPDLRYLKVREAFEILKGEEI